MKVVGDDEFELSTGKRFYAHGHIIGLDVSGEPDWGRVTEGYDGTIHWPIPDWWEKEEKELALKHYLTDEEMMEVANYMIVKWIELRNELVSRGGRSVEGLGDRDPEVGLGFHRMVGR